MSAREPLGAGLAGDELTLAGPLHPSPQELNPLVLAFIGDAVFDLHIRLALVAGGHPQARGLHEAAVAYVRAGAQAGALRRLEGELTDTEQGIVRRARNARPGHMPRNADPAEYHQATAFEALVGYLFLTGQTDRLKELLRRSALGSADQTDRQPSDA